MVIVLGFGSLLWSGRVTAKDLTTDNHMRAEVLIYYANETLPEVLNSRNYRRLFELLTRNGSEAAVQLEKSLKADAEKFPAEVEQDIRAVLHSAADYGFAAVVFTNALARNNQFMIFDGRRQMLRLDSFPIFPVDSSPVLEYSPLSRPDALRSAIEAATSLPITEGRRFILITNSHGDRTMALMPRVYADLSRVEIEEFDAFLLSPPASETLRPAWASYQGTTKEQYWRILAESSNSTNLALVVRQACQGGVLSISEAMAVPDKVDWIATSGKRDWKYGEVKYLQILANLLPEGILSEQLRSRLAAQGLEVATREQLLGLILLERLNAAVPGLLFLPLVVWLCWYAFRQYHSKSHR